MTRYVIIGAGAVGVTLAVELQAAGRDVVLVGRGRQLTLLQAGALTYRRHDVSTVVDVPAVAGPQDVKLIRGDILVVATKSQDADQVLAQWAREPVDGGRWRAEEVLPVFTLQNGLDTERGALRRFRTVVGSVLAVPSTYVTDGEISVPGPGLFWIGAHPDGAPSQAVRTIATDLEQAGFETQVVDDLSRWKAWKLLASTGFALDALYPPGPERNRAGRLLRDETRAILEAAGHSVADVGRESTIRLEALSAQPVGPDLRPGSSTWQSLARGRDVETDYLNGEVVRLAATAGRTAPLNAAVMARVHRAVRDGAAPGSLPVHDLTQVLAQARVLVDVDRLSAELAGAQPPALLDVRWALGDPDGEKHYLDGHLPGAVYVDLDTELAAPPSPQYGRHPLPDVDALQAAARSWGLRTGQPVVVYDDNGALSAARAWWLLRWAGIADVRILDGGLSAWVAAGGETPAGSHRPEPGNIELSAGALPTLSDDEVAALPARGALLDARAAERYRGEIEPVDPQAGHIPGALSLPTGDNLDATGRFRPVAELVQRFAAVTAITPGANDVGVYCGSGVTAAHEIAALQIAGIDAALYPGSWSAWSNDPARPVATGPEQT